MTTINDDSRRPIRLRAAALLAAVGRDEDSAPAARLHCLAALDALAQPVVRVEHDTVASLDPEARIVGALRLLGQLPVPEFAQPDVLAATRSARRAIRELR